MTTSWDLPFLILWIVAILAVALTGWAVQHCVSKPKEPEPETSGVKFKCRICGREFDPDPRMICDGGLQPCQLDENKVIPGDVLDLDFIREASADELRAAGIEPDDREKLLRGEHISTSFCICLECQDEMAEEQDDGE